MIQPHDQRLLQSPLLFRQLIVFNPGRISKHSPLKRPSFTHVNALVGRKECLST